VVSRGHGNVNPVASSVTRIVGISAKPELVSGQELGLGRVSGDVAATDRLRSTARNFVHGVLAANILAQFARNGRSFRAPLWFVRHSP
jgi:hypothetical protein